MCMRTNTLMALEVEKLEPEAVVSTNNWFQPKIWHWCLYQSHVTYRSLYQSRQLRVIFLLSSTTTQTWTLHHFGKSVRMRKSCFLFVAFNKWRWAELQLQTRINASQMTQTLMPTVKCHVRTDVQQNSKRGEALDDKGTCPDPVMWVEMSCWMADVRTWDTENWGS